MKKTISHIVSVVPDVVTNFTDYLKTNFDKNGQDTIENASGLVATGLKLILEPLVDNYFEDKSKEKLADFGINLYLKTSIELAISTVEEIYLEEFDIPNEKMADIVEKLQDMQLELTAESIFLTFTPKYHPVVLRVKKAFESFLRELDFTTSQVHYFRRRFNDEIDNAIKNAFGDEYDRHKKEVEEYLLDENETRLLYDMFELKKIGYADEEDLNYQRTYGSFKAVDELHKTDEHLDENKKEFEKSEENLDDVENLIEKYYDSFETKNYLQNILFIVADFGKGKSVFLKQYASKLAKNYMETKEGYIPVYFNLRDYGEYTSAVKLGVIGDFLLTKYQLDLEDTENKKKKYFFLIDSLDESGELTQHRIDNVINSIEKIQEIDKTKCFSNKLIITTRPIDDGLKSHLDRHNPYTIEEEKKKIAHYISIHGFKKSQFNEWMIEEIEKHHFSKLPKKSLLSEIIIAIKKDKDYDLYERLYASKTLSRSELQRPIFAYMIYKLLINKMDFIKLGKIGVYLSFLNLLTREAKYREAVAVDEEKEYASRNILHATAALWMYQKHRYNKSTIKKEDILKVFDVKDEKALDVEFLSHSYFGEDNNMLHFQHQSFAEILLAEYYLKIFIQTAVDGDSKIDDARYRLFLGKPTQQTMLFLRELLNLLKESIDAQVTGEVLEKRKLLLPLLSSMAIKEHNMLFSNDIFYRWYEAHKSEKERLENWYFDDEKLAQIVAVAREILDTTSNLMLEKAESKSALFDDEILVLKTNYFQNTFVDIDKWLALMVGNELGTSEGNYFNATVKDGTIFFTMMNNWYFTNQEANPDWAGRYFQGIDLRGNEKRIEIQAKGLINVDFSNSYFENIAFDNMTLFGVSFNESTFCDFDLISSNLRNVSFDNINFKNVEIGNYEPCILFNSAVDFVPMPKPLIYHIANYTSIHHNTTKRYRKVHIENGILYQQSLSLPEAIKSHFKTWRGLFLFGLKKKLFTIKEIKSWFTYKNRGERKIFEDLIDGLEEG